MRIGRWNTFALVGWILVAVWCILAAISPATGREIIPLFLGSAIGCFVVGIISDIIGPPRGKR